MASFLTQFALAIVLFLTFGCFNVNAQPDTPFEKSLFGNDEEAFKEAYKELQKGEDLFKLGAYSKAITHLLIANEFNPNNAELNLKIGQCYLISSDKLKSKQYLEKVLQLNPDINASLYLLLGRSYHLEMKWSEALEQYEKFITLTTLDEQERIDLARKRIEECNLGMFLVQSPIDVKIEALPSPINTQWAEYHPLISADESSLYFTSRRENTTGGKRDPNFDVYYEDIYSSSNKSGDWSEPISIGANVNTEEHDATVGLSPDGQQLFIYKDDGGNGNIYFCQLEGDEWSKPVKLNKNINSEYNEPTACFSYDGMTIYFVSDRIGGFGQNDIYVSKKNDDGEWGVAKNLGASINTMYNEDAVFMHPDGKTLYFSSEGHNTIGGYDIHKSVYDKLSDSWSAPKNLGYPINTPDDDVFFVLAASGERGYYSSIKPDGKGEKDIYMLTFNPEEDKPELTLLKGKVIDSKTGQPIEAKIEVVDNALNEIVANAKSNKLTGEYLISLPSGRDYGITVTAEGYFFHSENINIPESSPYFELSNNISLTKIGVGKSIVLNFIYFDYDKAILKNESIIELERVLNLMNSNPKLGIEIAGHTDNKGTEDYNINLSEERARSVVNWLLEHNIEQSRMTSKGYGFSKPIDNNETEEGRAKNRRTEFTVLEYESTISSSNEIVGEQTEKEPTNTDEEDSDLEDEEVSDVDSEEEDDLEDEEVAVADSEEEDDLEDEEISDADSEEEDDLEDEEVSDADSEEEDDLEDEEVAVVDSEEEDDLEDEEVAVVDSEEEDDLEDEEVAVADSEEIADLDDAPINADNSIKEEKSLPPANTSSKPNRVTEVKTFSTTKFNYYSTHPIPIDPELPSGIIFKVQIGAYTKLPRGEQLKGLYPLISNKIPNNLYRCSVGEFRTYNEAKEAQKIVRQSGFSDAFIISFYNGEKIHIAKAVNLQLEE